MGKLKKRMCALLVAILLPAGFTVPVSAAADGCKVIDVSLESVFVADHANTMNITVASLDYSGGFTLTVYDGGTERQKIFEGEDTVSGYDWNSGAYGRTVVTVPITAHARGIAQFDIYLAQENGSVVLNTAVFRVFGTDEVSNVLLISDSADQYTYLQGLLKEKGALVSSPATLHGDQIDAADLIIIGTNELGSLPGEMLYNKNILIFKNGALSDTVNGFLSANGSQLRYGANVGDVRTQEYGNGLHYGIINTELDKDLPVKNRYFNMADAAAVIATETGNTEVVVQTDSNSGVLMAELLMNQCKLAVAGGDFSGDKELAFAADDMYAQLFSGDAYDPPSMRPYSNFNVTSNVLDWLLPIPDYQDTDAQTIIQGGADGAFVSVTGTVVTESEAIDSHGNAFHNYIYLQDETGGIRVFGINRDMLYTYAKWKIQVKGFVSSYGGERELVVFDQFKDLTIVSRKDHSFEPKVIAASQMNDSSLVGTLIRLTGKVSGLSEGALTVKDDSGEAAVYVAGYIGSTLGSWGVGKINPEITYGCTLEVTGILSRQSGESVIRIRNTAEVLLTYDKDGNAVEPPAERNGAKFGGGLAEVALPRDSTMSIGSEKKEFTEYMKLMVNLGFISAALIPGKDLPVGSAFEKMLAGAKLYIPERGKSYDSSVRGAALQLLCALGYEILFSGDSKAANETAVISQSRILAGISANPKSILTAKDAARMLYNALEIPFFGQSYFTDNNDSVYEELDECPQDKLNLKKTTGVITETHYTKTSGNLPLQTVRMSFTSDGKTGEDLFYSDIPEIDTLVGLYVEAFIRDDSDNDRNIAGIMIGTRNTLYRLPSEDYAGFEGNSVRHRDGAGRVKGLNVGTDAKLFINGVDSGAVTAETMNKVFVRENTLSNVYGWYNMIDNNNDGAVDFIMADEYQDFIVNSMDKQTFRLDDKISDVAYSLYFNPEFDTDVHIIYEKSNGAAADFSDIEKGDVLSLRISRLDGRNMVWAKVVITKGSVKGKISALNKEDMKLEINGRWYDYIEIDDLRQDDFLFNMGDNGKFFVNMKGVVIMKDLKSMPYTNYAFVIAYGMVTANLNEIPAMAVYLPTGEWTSYYFAQNVTVRDGGFSETLKREEVVAQYLTDNTTNELTKNTRTLVNFELSEQGEVKTISFPYNNATGKNDKGRLTIDRKYNQPDGDNIPEGTDAFAYDQILKNIGDAYLTDKTVIFDITLNGSETMDSIDAIQDRINIVPVSKLQDGCKPAIQLFDMGDGNECAAAITINATQHGTTADNLFIVTKTVETMVDGDVMTKLCGWVKGEAKDLILDPDVEITDFMSEKADTLGSGDLILYNENAFGRVSQISILVNVALAKGYLPDIYGNGVTLLPKVNFYSDTSNPKQTVQYYYGLVTEKYVTKPYGKMVLAKNNTVYPTTLLDKLQFAAMVATGENTIFYRINQSNPRSPVQKSSLADCIPAVTGSYAVRNGDLAVVKTVNGIATDVILISPPDDVY